MWRGRIPRNARAAGLTVLLGALLTAPTGAVADEGGVSFWIPGFFGSLAAAPQQPGWSLTAIDYYDSVKAGGNVALAREFEIGGSTPRSISMPTSTPASTHTSI
jgi:hypothetical protein